MTSDVTEPPLAAGVDRAADPLPLFAALVRSVFISERVVALVVANRLLLETRWLRTSLYLVAAAARVSRYLSRLLTVLEGIVALLSGIKVLVPWNAAAELALPKEPTLACVARSIADWASTK